MLFIYFLNLTLKHSEIKNNQCLCAPKSSVITPIYNTVWTEVWSPQSLLLESKSFILCNMHVNANERM